jgi:hypothetical protein
MPEDNKDLVRRLVQGWQHEHRSEVAEELISGDFVDRTPGPASRGPGRTGSRS